VFFIRGGNDLLPLSKVSEGAHFRKLEGHFKKSGEARREAPAQVDAMVLSGCRICRT
jgi:hypothetical protein